MEEVKIKIPPSQMRVSLDQMERQEAEWLELQRFLAKMHRAKYEACVAAGFNEAQALELCKEITARAN